MRALDIHKAHVYDTVCKGAPAPLFKAPTP